MEEGIPLVSNSLFPKEVPMKGRIQIFGLIGLSVLAILIVSAPGAKPLPDILLKATFEPLLESTIPGTPASYCNILNDFPVPYESTSDHRYANRVVIASPGQMGNLYLTLYKNNSAGRFIRLEFDNGEPQVPENPLYCASNLYFLADKLLDGPEAYIFRFKTLYRYSEEIVGGKRYLTNTKTAFDFSKMKKGEAGIVATVFDFYVEDDPRTLGYDESEDWYSLSYQYPARVLCDDIDYDGKLEWVMTPVQEPFYDTNEGDKYYPFGSVIRGLYSNYYMHCLHGYFLFPFKLTLDPK